MSALVSITLENNKEDVVNNMLVICECIIKPAENAELDIKHDSQKIWDFGTTSPQSVWLMWLHYWYCLSIIQWTSAVLT